MWVILIVLVVPIGAYLASTSVACRLPAYPVSPDAGRWTERASLPTPRSELAAAAAGGFGDLACAYDPQSDAWETGLAPMPTAREHLASAVVDEKLFVIGGR